MRLVFKQKIISWFDSYNIFDDSGNIAYEVKGKLSWGHLFKIYDAQGIEVGTVRQKLLTFLPRFEIYMGEQYVGCINKQLSLFVPKYNVDCNGWRVDGNILQWNYRIVGRSGEAVATISKQILNWTDTYIIDVNRPEDALCTLMIVIAIDAEKCSSND